MPNIDSIPLKARELQGLLWLKSAVKTIESNWAKRNQLGPGSTWAWVNMGLAHFDSESNWAKESRWVGTVTS